MKHFVREFTATDDTGKSHAVRMYEEELAIFSHSIPGGETRVPSYKSLESDAGPVYRTSKGVYELHADAGMLLLADDSPDAPAPRLSRPSREIAPLPRGR